MDSLVDNFTINIHCNCYKCLSTCKYTQILNLPSVDGVDFILC